METIEMETIGIETVGIEKWTGIMELAKAVFLNEWKAAFLLL